MKPGREMDALVAEEVMGWALQAEPYTCWNLPNGDQRIYVPSYSTDIGAAWQVVDRILDMRGEDGHYRKERFVMSVPEESRGDLVRWRSEHAAHIICAAALSAFDVEV